MEQFYRIQIANSKYKNYMLTGKPNPNVYRASPTGLSEAEHRSLFRHTESEPNPSSSTEHTGGSHRRHRKKGGLSYAPKTVSQKSGGFVSRDTHFFPRNRFKFGVQPDVAW